MSVLLALAAAVAYGASDFIGGLLSRRASFLQVAVVAQTFATLATLAALPFTSHVDPSALSMGWGAAGGVGGALGVLALYRGLGAGRMSVVAPISGVIAAGVPVLAGLLLGERPSMLAAGGIVLALPAVWLVSSGDQHAVDGAASSAAGVLDGLLAGLGFGLLFLGLGRAGPGVGLWPVAAAATASWVVLLVAAVVGRAARRPSGVVVAGSAAVGGLAATATVLFFLATHRGLLALASVIASLYPAVTVLLARFALSERFGRLQMLGLGMATVAVVLIVAG
ncbi:MAG: EamA family transporter [Mycobacteriales bacterium]